MKIMISANTSWNIYNFRIPLIKALSKKNEIIIVTKKDQYTTRLISLDLKIETIHIDSKGMSLKNDILLFFKYYYLIKKYKPDYFFGFTIKPNIYFNLASFFSKVKNINTITGLGTSFMNKGFLNFIVKLMYKIALLNSYITIFQNNDDLNTFKNDIIIKYKKNYKVVKGSGVDLNFYKYSKNLLKDKDSLNFLFVGRVIPDKGIIELISAISNIKKKYKNIKFKFIGSLDYENFTLINKIKIKKLISDDLIEYLGYKEDIRSYVIESNCLILPSYREGLPRSLLEAASIGRPIIATDVAGCREIVKNGYNGFLCKVKDSLDLEKKIIKFINLNTNKILEMSTNSRKLVENKFELNKIISSYLEIIK